MSLLEVFQALEGSPIGATIQSSTWAFAVIESIHLLALATLGGAVLLVDLRVLGMGLTGRPVKELAAQASRLMAGALIVLIISGIGLFLSEATKCYYSTPFWIKITTLAIALVFTYTVRRPLLNRLDVQGAGGAAKGLAILSIGMWLVVAASGRWIGFSG
jgi:hypothetical protein